MDDQERQEQESEDPKGRFECKVPGYTGYIQFPYPLSYAAFKAWWQLGVEPIKTADLKSLEFKYWHGLWEGAKMLLLDYDGWHVDGIHTGQVRGDDIPLAIEEWVITSAKGYILHQLDPKKVRMLLTLF